MTLLGHLLIWDVRRFRWTIIGWLALVTVCVLFESTAPGVAQTPRAVRTMDLIGGLLWSAIQLTTIFLIPRIVQADPLVGTNAFWMTRPIPRSTLLAAKSILVMALFVAVPVAAESVLMAASHMPARQIALVGAEIALFRSLCVAALMAAASVTPDLARFAALWGIIIVGAAVTSAIAAAVIPDTPTAAFTYQDEMTGPDSTADVVAAAGCLASALLMIGVQYATRRRRWAALTISAALSLTWLLAHNWAWPILEKRVAPSQWAASGTAPRLVLDPATVTIEKPPYVVTAGHRLIRARVQVANVPAGWFATATLVEAHLNQPSGASLESLTGPADSRIAFEGSTESPDIVTARHLMGIDRLRAERAEHELNSTVIFSGSGFEGATQSAMGYEGVFLTRLSQLEVAGTLPVRPGAVHADESERIRVLGVTQLPEHLQVEIRRSSARSVFDLDSESERLFYLRNPRLSEAVEGVLSARLPDVSGILSEPFANDGENPFSIQQSVVEFPFIDERWMADAELVILRQRQGGRVVRRIQMSDLRIPQSTDKTP